MLSAPLRTRFDRLLPPTLTSALPFCSLSSPSPSSSSTPSLRAQASSLFTPSSRVIFLLGGPGAGKGCISSRAGVHGWRAASVGALLRAAARDDASVASVLRSGGVVSGAVSAGALLRWMRRADGGAWLVDGFPRSVESAKVWDEVGGVSSLAVDLIVPEEVLVRRLRGRGREDDLEDGVVRRRLEKHRQEAPRLRRFFEEKDIYTAVDGNKDVEAVWEEVHSIIGDCRPE